MPEIAPVEELIDRPAGSPVADQVIGATPPLEVSFTLLAVPTVPVWVPGLVIATGAAGTESDSVPSRRLSLSKLPPDILNPYTSPGCRTKFAVPV